MQLLGVENEFCGVLDGRAGVERLWCESVLGGEFGGLRGLVLWGGRLAAGERVPAGGGVSVWLDVEVMYAMQTEEERGK